MWYLVKLLMDLLEDWTLVHSLQFSWSSLMYMIFFSRLVIANFKTAYREMMSLLCSQGFRMLAPSYHENLLPWWLNVYLVV